MSRKYPSQPIVGVGAVILHEGRVLLARRGNPPLVGEWSIPGGKLELGEKLRAGLEREVREETGLVVEANELLDVFDSIFSDADGRTEYHYVLVDFLCRLRSGTAVAASDASELAWAAPQELESYGLRPVTIGVIRKALALTAR